MNNICIEKNLVEAVNIIVARFPYLGPAAENDPHTFALNACRLGAIPGVKALEYWKLDQI